MSQVNRSARPRPLVPFLVTLLATGALMLAATAAAGSMISLVPADSVFVLRYAAGGSSYPALEQDLEALDTGSFHRVARGTLEPGMTFLLCSDGLTECVDDASIGRTLARSDLAAQECVDQLLLAALDAGGDDNITAVIVRCR